MLGFHSKYILLFFIELGCLYWFVCSRILMFDLGCLQSKLLYSAGNYILRKPRVYEIVWVNEDVSHYLARVSTASKTGAAISSTAVRVPRTYGCTCTSTCRTSIMLDVHVRTLYRTRMLVCASLHIQILFILNIILLFVFWGCCLVCFSNLATPGCWVSNMIDFPLLKLGAWVFLVGFRIMSLDL